MGEHAPPGGVPPLPYPVSVTEASYGTKVNVSDEDRYRLKNYWTKGEGLAKWAGKPHPWTELYQHLKKHMPAEMAKRVAAQWHREVLGIWPGEKKGKNPTGPG